MCGACNMKRHFLSLRSSFRPPAPSKRNGTQFRPPRSPTPIPRARGVQRTSITPPPPLRQRAGNGPHTTGSYPPNEHTAGAMHSKAGIPGVVIPPSSCAPSRRPPRSSGRERVNIPHEQQGFTMLRSTHSMPPIRSDHNSPGPAAFWRRTKTAPLPRSGPNANPGQHDSCGTPLSSWGQWRPNHGAPFVCSFSLVFFGGTRTPLLSA